MKPEFTSSFIRIRKKIRCQNAILLVGLPGVGFASKLAVDHLVRQLKAEHVASLYSPHFPNQVLATSKGNLRPFSLKFYYKKVNKQHLFFLKGDLQPLTVEGQYEVTAQSLRYFSEVGGSKVYSMAGLVSQVSDKPRQIYVSSTHQKELTNVKKTLGVKINTNFIPIVGMAGLVPSLAPLFKLIGCCFLVETTGEAIDAVAATRLVEMVGKLTGKKIPVENLKKKAERAKNNLEKFAKQTQPQEQQAIAGAAPVMPKDTLNYIR